MIILAYVIILLGITFWLAVCIAAKINWIKEDRQAKAEKNQPKKTSIYIK